MCRWDGVGTFVNLWAVAKFDGYLLGGVRRRSLAALGSALMRDTKGVFSVAPITSSRAVAGKQAGDDGSRRAKPACCPNWVHHLVGAVSPRLVVRRTKDDWPGFHQAWT